MRYETRVAGVKTMGFIAHLTSHISLRITRPEKNLLVEGRTVLRLDDPDKSRAGT